jgi:hypothetical protein
MSASNETAKTDAGAEIDDMDLAAVQAELRAHDPASAVAHSEEHRERRQGVLTISGPAGLQSGLLRIQSSVSERVHVIFGFPLSPDIIRSGRSLNGHRLQELGSKAAW